MCVLLTAPSSPGFYPFLRLFLVCFLYEVFHYWSQWTPCKSVNAVLSGIVHPPLLSSCMEGSGGRKTVSGTSSPVPIMVWVAWQTFPSRIQMYSMKTSACGCGGCVCTSLGGTVQQRLHNAFHCYETSDPFFSVLLAAVTDVLNCALTN